jgi:glycyl-tRNA synthetase beta chain
MSSPQDLLIEIGTEELPPKALRMLSEAFAHEVEIQLNQLDLQRGPISSFATPRRLAILVERLDSAQSNKEIERRGPALKAAFDTDNNPTKAAEGFARSCGVTVADLEVSQTAKGAWLVYRKIEPGRSTKELLPEIVNNSLARLPIPKRMRWGSGNEEFVRPVHWVVLLFGESIVPARILGQQSDRMTRGHRFHHPDPIPIDHPSQYQKLLKSTGYVIADFAERRQLITRLATQTVTQQHARAVIDQGLLEEVTSLTEWPHAVLGSFDERFLDIPSECLVQAMQAHQKYFPVVDAKGALLPLFIAITNIDSKDIEQIRSGNERVIRPRFSDAAFFWEQDLKHPLEHHIESLKRLKFQDQLGSMHDKSGRIAALADHIADQIGLDKALAMRAAWLCKCDLMSDMVGEFANLQGIMGRYYAQHAGEDPQVAQAMEEVYLPRHAGDRLPQTDCGKILAIVDRVDTLVGIFAIGQRPTGAKDPYGLRRAALGVLRILIETPLDLDLEQLLQQAAEGLAGQVDAMQKIPEVFDYIMERLKAYYSEQSIPSDSIDAVLARRPTRPADFNQRVRAVTEFRKLPAAESLAAANKRIRNILRKTDEAIPDSVDFSKLTDQAETTLANHLKILDQQVTPLFSSGDYADGLRQLASLKEPVDRFFDQVMVMVDDRSIRTNRLALLGQLEDLFLRVADLSRLQM